MKDKKTKALSEREMMEDGLNSQKQATAAYNTGAGECANAQLRSTFISILADEHELGAKIFDAMSQRGWYQPQEAEDSQIVSVKQKFTNN
ncbi:MAG: spore coat protein [Clostridia bacterium]|nr:spore coat protein [Clostridia bacterium]